MAIQLNTFSKSGIMNILYAQPGTFASTYIRVFPSTVAFPSTPIDAQASLPGGYILTLNTATNAYTLSGNTISITTGPTAANTTAAGTLAWWAIVGTGAIISNSIGLSGSGAIMTVNTLTPTSGQSVTISFNFTLAS